MHAQRVVGPAVAAGVLAMGVGAALGGQGPAQVVEQSREVLATSGFGRPIEILRLHHAGGSGKPALLVVAGIDPRQAGSTEVAQGMALRLSKAGEALEHGDVYIVPRLNPDGFEGDPAHPHVRPERASNPPGANAIDADRDGRFNEDPPVDLDGDGRILQMRIKNPPPGSGLKAEWIAEDADPRLMRRADHAKGERPMYALLEESRDADGDGLFGEDGFDGVELDRNFPYHWPEFRDEAGKYPLSEPETRALAEWMQAHDELVAVLVLSPSDNLVNTPPGGKMDETGAAPATNSVLDADRGVYERVGEKFKEITRQKEAPTRDNEGTLQGWAYAERGIWSFSTPGWVRPDQMKDADADKADAKKEAGEEHHEGTPGGDAAKASGDKPRDDQKQPKRERVDSDDGKWLALSDARATAGKAAGFVDWRPFKHPQLGDVEIGGFVPGYRLSIPPDEIDRVADEQTRFVADLLGRLARLAVRPPRVERLGQGVWRVSVEAVNEGAWPTRAAMGVKVHRLPPTRWTIGVDRKRILAGERAQRSDSIAGGDSLEGTWTITGSDGETLKATLHSPECGDQDVEIKLDASTEAKP
jgi:hypothetical protein